MSHGDLTRGVQRSPLAIIACRRMESLGTRLNNNHMTLYNYVYIVNTYTHVLDYEFVIADGLLAGAMRSESMYAQLAEDYKSGKKKRNKKDGEFCGMRLPVCSVMWYSPLHWLWRSLLYIGTLSHWIAPVFLYTLSSLCNYAIRDMYTCAE